MLTAAQNDLFSSMNLFFPNFFRYELAWIKRNRQRNCVQSSRPRRRGRPLHLLLVLQGLLVAVAQVLGALAVLPVEVVRLVALAEVL